jgi:LuxR family maltose regulon positive regulatory protein
MSSTPILTTKLYIPPPGTNLVSRSRLIETLNQGLARNLTVISAPAGFGKTTLLSDWLYTKDEGGKMKGEKENLHPSKVAWLSLDESDNDPAEFLTYVIAACQQIDTDIGRDILTTLQTSAASPTETMLVMLINDIARAGQDFILVLDDYHVIKEPAVHHALNFLLNHFPPGMHLVIAGRVDPPLQLSRLRVRGEITEIRADDLRFNATEAENFFNDLLNLNLSTADIAALDSRTEGWIASLQLAALSLQDRADRHEFVEAFSGSHRYVIDYLVEEVMADQPEELRRFLRQTSILDRFCAPLCDAILQISSSRQILQQFEADNLFLIPLDDERRWYRYHHLFADFLQQQLRLQDPERVSTLHRRAGRWFEAEGLVNDAVHHFLAAAEYGQVVRLLEEHSMPTILQGHVRLVEGWLKALPPQWQIVGPRTSLAFAWMLLLRGQYSEVAGHLENVENLITQQAEVNDQLDTADIQCEILALRAVLISLQTNPLEGIKLARQAVDMAPADNVYLQGLTYFSLGTTYNYAGQVVPAMEAYQQAIPLCQASNNRVATVLCSTNLTMLAYTRGQLHLAADVCRQVLDAMGRERTPALGAVYSSLGIIHYEWNQLDAAYDYLQQGLAWGRLVGHPAALSFCLINLSRVLQAQGKIKEAAGTLQEAVDILKDGTPAWVTPEVVGRQVEFALAHGDTNAAESILQQSGVSLDDEVDFAVEVVQLAWVRWLAAQGRDQESLALARRLQKSAEAGERTGRLIQVLVQIALLNFAQNEFDSALEALNRALNLAQPAGYIRTFVDAGKPMANLLQKMKNKDEGLNTYVTELLKAFDSDDALSRPSAPVSQPLIEPLSDRELEILHLMAAGLSNPEIGQQLVITPGTVKVHVHNIYGKLGVSGRVKAVAKAKELNLL